MSLMHYALQHKFDPRIGKMCVNAPRIEVSLDVDPRQNGVTEKEVFQFEVDTGAKFTMIPAPLADYLGIKYKKEKENTVEIQTSDGHGEAFIGRLSLSIQNSRHLWDCLFTCVDMSRFMKPIIESELKKRGQTKALELDDPSVEQWFNKMAAWLEEGKPAVQRPESIEVPLMQEFHEEIHKEKIIALKKRMVLGRNGLLQEYIFKITQENFSLMLRKKVS